jgi:hypothetical protein
MPVAAQRRAGGDVDDHAAGAAGDHVPGGGAVAVEVAFQVGGQDFLEGLIGVLPELPIAARRPATASVGHHDVDLAVGVDAPIHQAVHLRRVGDIGGHGNGPPAGGADLSNGLIDLRLGPGGTHQLRPRLCQRFRHRPAQTTAGAGDHRGFTIEA